MAILNQLYYFFVVTMKNLILCLYFIFAIGISRCDIDSRTGYNTMDTFEFGPIHDIGEVTFSKSGSIGGLEKNVRIPIVLPPCSRLTYVRVDVDNTIGPPYVRMDFDMRTVIIKYRTLQYSISNYVVTAKSIPGPC